MLRPCRPPILTVMEDQLRRIFLASAAVVALAVPTACNDHTPAHRAGNAAPAGRASSPSTRAASATGQPSPTGSATASRRDTGSAGSPRCRTADLTVSAGGTDSSSGHRSVVVTFTNSGDGRCRLHGYPGVAALDTDGTQVAQATRTRHGYEGGLASGPPPTVTLSAGQTASALVEATAFDTSGGGACTPYAGLLVTVPDATRSTRVPWDTDACAGLQVHPVVPGSSGRSGD